MSSVGVASLVVAAFTANIQVTSAADLPVKSRPTIKQVAAHTPQRDSKPTATERLFKQFLEFLNQREQ